jgi:2',3'-cyclic-nucleotide 2'-phosphodiesterase (5'-nucleotidase family)
MGKSARLTILHTNDLHANYEAWTRCAAFIKRRRSELPPGACLVLDAGDHFDMSVDECGQSGGRLHLDLLGEAGVDAFTPGNNEFYRNPREALAELSLASPFPWLLSTVTEADGSQFAGCRPSLLVDRGIVVGLLGALDPMDRAVEELHGLCGHEPGPRLVAEARKLRAAGAEVIVLLSHCGLRDDLILADSTEGELDVIVGGHSHEALQEAVIRGRTIIVQAGDHGKFVGELELRLEEGRIAGHSYRLHALPDSAEGDAAQLRILASWREETRRILSEELCVLDRDLDPGRLARLAAAVVRKRFDAELGMMFAPAATGGLSRGALRLGDLHGISRSFLTPACLELSGTQLLGILRERHDPAVTSKEGWGIGFRPQGQAFGVMQFDGLEWTEGEAGPEGAMIGGEPLVPERRYRVGAVTHLRDSEGGGYPSLDGTKVLSFTRFRYLRELMAEAFRSGEAQSFLARD